MAGFGMLAWRLPKIESIYQSNKLLKNKHEYSDAFRESLEEVSKKEKKQHRERKQKDTVYISKEAKYLYDKKKGLV